MTKQIVNKIMEKKEIYLGVVGTRTFGHYDMLKNKLDEYREKYEIVNIVSGGATGADALAAKYCLGELGKNPIVFKPNWGKYGPAAGPIRNKLIVENSDIVVAFWDGKSRGTLSSINLAKNAGKEVEVVNYV